MSEKAPQAIFPIDNSSRQKSRLLPAATQRTSAKAPQANFAD